MNKTRLILVGGFLGSGKTTLLWETASRLMNRGNKVGLITNDQAPELVDTAILKKKDMKVAEVSGSCFCCNFDGFVQALNDVRKEADADFVIAEPVGSCTDLSATILQPLKKNMNRDLIVSPLSVLADPKRLSEILDGKTAGLHKSAAYIYQKQLEESDLIVITKSDLIDSEKIENLIVKTKKKFPNSDVFSISTKTGDGLEQWLNEVLTRNDTGKRLVEVDYTIYAEGEAVLGWLNATLELQRKNTDWDDVVIQLMKTLNKTFEEEQTAVGHIKMILDNSKNYFSANLTGTGDTLVFSGKSGISDRAKLTINARVETTPASLEKTVRKVISEVLNGEIMVNEQAWKCLSPGKPEPTFRFNYVVPNDLILPKN